MVERRELITICRHIGNMMDAGVDILRITQVLRAQTDNARLLRVYDQFDHDLRMGANIAEAMARASDVFSPFMITLVRQAEQRSDLETVSKHVAAAFLKIAEFLQQDEDSRAASEAVAATVIAAPVDISAFSDTAETWPLTLRALENFTDKLQMIALRALTLLAGLLLSLAAVWWAVEMKYIEHQWLNVTLCSVSALFIAGAGVWVRRQIEKEKRVAERCSFCGHEESEEFPLRPVPGFPGAAICPRCATLLANRTAAREAGAEGATPEVAAAAIAAAPENSSPAPAKKPAPRVAAPAAAAAPTHPARAGRTLSGGGDEATYE